MRTEWMLRKDGATPGGRAGAAAEPGASLAMAGIIGYPRLRETEIREGVRRLAEIL
jgi:hypothetical protein